MQQNIHLTLISEEGLYTKETSRWDYLYILLVLKKAFKLANPSAHPNSHILITTYLRAYIQVKVRSRSFKKNENSGSLEDLLGEVILEFRFTVHLKRIH